MPLSADFDAIQANVFTPICTACHIGASAPKGLILDAQHSYNLLMSIPSTEVPSVLRVSPGDPNNSYLIQKLEGHAAVGAQMPLDEAPLPASTIAFVVQWITDGAQPGAAANSTAAAMAAAFQIAAVAPENGSVLTAAPAQLVVGFTREPDASRTDAQAVRLQQLAAAGAPTSATTMPAVVSVPAGNSRALMLRPLAPLSSGRYRIVLSAQPGTELSALDGAQITRPQPDDDGDRVIAEFTVAGKP